MASFWTRYMMISSCISVYMVLFLACNTQASEVMLTSNLTSGNLAYNDQVIVFRCVARGTILVWESDHYIGPIADGRDLRLTFVDPPGHTEPSQLVDGTVATLVSVTTVDGDTVIESELRILASLATSLSSAITCTNNGRGGRNTTEFRVVSRTVELTSNLTDGNIAYDNQVIVFRCIIRGTILVWKSDDYIGPIVDGRDLRLTFVDPPGHIERSQLVDGTVARVINIVEDMDGILIESELVIRASLSMRSASVTCTNNGLGRMNTTYFRVMTERPSTTTTPGTLPENSTVISSVDSSAGGTSTEESVSDRDPGPQDGSNVGVAVGVSVVFLLLIAAAVIAVIAVVYIRFIKRHIVILEPIDYTEKGDGLEGECKAQYIDQPPPLPPGDHTPPGVSEQPESTVNEKDPIDSVGVPCSEPEGYSGMLSSPDPKGQLKDFRLTEAKQNVENEGGFPGDTGAYIAPNEGEVDRPLDPPEDVGLQEAVNESGLQIDSMVPTTESGTGNTVLLVPETEISYWNQSPRVGHVSLPSDHCIIPTSESEQSYAETKAKPISLPVPLDISTRSIRHGQHPYANLQQVGAPSHSSQQGETDTEIESDYDTGASSSALDTFQIVYPSSSTPLTSLRPDPKGGSLMISGSVMDSETGSRPCMAPLAFNIELDIESDQRISEPEEVIEEIADAHCEADDKKQESDPNPKQDSVLHVVKVVRA